MQGHCQILLKDCIKVQHKTVPKRAVETLGNASRAAVSITKSATRVYSSIPSSTGADEAKDVGAATRSSASIATLLTAESCLISASPRHSQAQLLPPSSSTSSPVVER
jgi:hypothetical protein